MAPSIRGAVAQGVSLGWEALDETRMVGAEPGLQAGPDALHQAVQLPQLLLGHGRRGVIAGTVALLAPRIERFDLIRLRLRRGYLPAPCRPARRGLRPPALPSGAA